jgi:ubiquinone/menaquinone biosynthesis C-methylase UbiE
LMHNTVIYAPLSTPKTLFDVCCGTGIVTRQLSKLYSHAQRVFGVDLSRAPKQSAEDVLTKC